MKCSDTLLKDSAADPDAALKKVILGFAELNVTPEMLESSIGHVLAQCSPAEIADLRKIYKAIDDGEATWAEFSQPKHPDEPKEPEKPKDLSKDKPKQASKPKAEKPAAQTTQEGEYGDALSQPDPFKTGELL
jgi:hypothetical protein